MIKKVKVVMLSTEKASKLLLLDNILSYCKSIKIEKYISNNKEEEQALPQHLYLVSDEEIKDNDHFMSAFYGYPLQNTKEWREKQKELLGKYPDLSDLKQHKIIATTDKSLKIPINKHLIRLEEADERDETFLLPQIPESFIEAYVKANGEINEVEVEYEQKRWGYYSKNINSESINHNVKEYLFLTDNNEVIISLKEEDKLYNINDIKKLIELYNTTYIDGDINTWIKENL